MLEDVYDYPERRAEELAMLARWRVSGWVLIAMALFVLPASCLAGGWWPTIPSGERWLAMSCCAWHQGQHQKYREINPGMGIEYNWQHLGLAAGGFINSTSKDSHYAVVTWRTRPWHNWRFGALLGRVDGYQKGGKASYGLIPVISAEGKEYGTNFVIAPPLLGNPWTIGVQFKKRWE